MFVYPVREGVELPPAFVEHAIVPDDPLEPPGGRDRREPRPLDRRVDRDRPALRRRARRGGRPGRVPRALLRLPARSRSSSGASGRATASISPGRARAGSTLEIAWFTIWQAAVSTGAHARRRAAARVGDRALPLPRPLARRGARARAVRAADGRRRDRVPRPPARTRPSAGLGDPRSRTSSSTSPSSCASSGRSGRGSTRASATPPRRSAQARSGATRVVTLPLLAPGARGAASIVFLFCFTSFGVIVILGGSGTRRSRRRSTTRRHGSSTSGRPPRSRCCSSAPSPLTVVVAGMLERRLGVRFVRRGASGAPGGP